VAVEIDGEHTRGMTVIDDRRVLARPAPNATVLDTIDADAAFAAIVTAVATRP
jgi:inosine-uridine nucleoside N-ribohydrolase